MVVAAGYGNPDSESGKKRRAARARRAQAVLSCAALAALGIGLVAEAAGPEPSFAPAAGSPFALSDIIPSAIAVGDLNGDGKPDAVTPHIDSGRVTVMLGNGTGGFTPSAASPIDTGGEAPFSVQIADLNRDGKQDVVTANGYSHDVSVLLGDGTGNLTPAAGSPFAVDGLYPNDLVVVDLNGDDKPDIATSNFQSYSASVLLGDGLGGFSLAPDGPFELGYYPFSIATADVNGDGHPDLVTSNIYLGFPIGYASILLGDGAGGFAPTEYTGLYGYIPVSLAISDVNGDGKADLIAANNSTTDVAVVLGDGTGGFAPAPNSPFALDGYRPNSVDVADINADGKPDVVVSNDSGDVSVLVGDGAGDFTLASGSPFAVGGDRPFGIAAVDVNGDIKRDLLTPNSFSDTMSVLLNTTIPTDTTPPTGTPQAVGFKPSGIAYVPVRLRDTGSGVQQVLLTPRSSNVHLEYPLGTLVTNPFAFPLARPDVTVFAVKNTNSAARVELQLWDAAGNTGIVDPIVANLEIKNGPVHRTFNQIPQAERYVRLQNGTPGLQAATLWINGKVVTRGGLANGQVVNLDVARWLKAGEKNTARILAAGPTGATAVLTIGDTPTGGGAAARALTLSGGRINLEFSR